VKSVPQRARVEKLSGYRFEVWSLFFKLLPLPENRQAGGRQHQSVDLQQS
jgi:hypothetical protein